MSRQEDRAAERARRRADQVDTSDIARAAASGASAAPRVPLPQFLREVRGELRRVAWPSGNEVVSMSITVLVVTAVLTLLVWGMDWFLKEFAVLLFS